MNYVEKSKAVSKHMDRIQFWAIVKTQASIRYGLSLRPETEYTKRCYKLWYFCVCREVEAQNDLRYFINLNLI